MEKNIEKIDILDSLELVLKESKSEIQSLRKENERLKKILSQISNYKDVVPDEDYNIYYLAYLVKNGSSEKNEDLESLMELFKIFESSKDENRILIKKKLSEIFFYEILRDECYKFVLELILSRFENRIIDPFSSTWEIVSIFLLSKAPKEQINEIILKMFTDENIEKYLKKYYTMNVQLKSAIESSEYTGYIPEWYIRKWLHQN